MERKIGMAVDNIVEVQIVTSDGQLLQCSKTENADLFWGVCGCGSAFGIVVELTVRVVRLPEGSMLPKAQTVHVPLGSMGLPSRTDLIKRFRDFFEREENADTHGVMILPGGGPVIEECVWLGSVGEDCTGTESTLERAKQDWAAHDKTTGWFTLNKDLQERHYHSDIQCVAELIKPQAAYIKTLELSGLPDAAIDILDKSVDASVSPHAKDCTVILATANSVSAKYSKDRNAYFHREAAWHMILVGSTPIALSGEKYKAKMAESTRWACETHQNLSTLMPSIALGGYNVMEGTPAEQIYGGNLAALRELKGRYDRDNLFALNANILDGA
jgi:FAD/FMN-containing dehydrogenase